MIDRIESVRLSSVRCRCRTPISDAKVFTGRQRPMTEVAFLFAEITTDRRASGPRLQLLQARRRAGPVRPRARGRAGADRRGPERHRPALDEARVGRRLGRPQRRSPRRRSPRIDIALWDLKAKRAGLPLAKLLGAHRDSVRCYNTSGGFLHAPIEQVLENASASLARRHRRHQDQGRPARPGRSTSPRVAGGPRAHRRRVPLMVDANQQWDRADRPARRARPRGVRAGVDRGAARRLRRRGPRPARRRARHARSPPARCSPASPSTSS